MCPKRMVVAVRGECDISEIIVGSTPNLLWMLSIYQAKGTSGQLTPIELDERIA